MKCPYCKKELQVPGRAIMNMESYHNSVKVRTECCKKIVQLYPKFSFSVSTFYGGKDAKVTDDWGC